MPETSLISESAVLNQGPIALEYLPIELLHLILSFLEWRDVLSIRQVSRNFYRLSKDRNVWMSLFRRIADAPLPDTIFLNKKESAHSQPELEDAILKPKKTNIAFDLFQFNHRLCEFRKDDSLMKLLPGGRWALAWRGESEEIIVYDLDSAGPQLNDAVLTKSAVATRYHSPHIAIDVDTSTPYLTFRLAMFSEDSSRMTGEAQKCFVQVWQVGSVFDSTGNIVGLSSSPLSFFCPVDGRVENAADVALFGPYFLHAIDYWPDGASQSWAVINWKEANGKGSAFPCRYLSVAEFKKIIIPLSDDLVLVYSSDGSVSAYDPEHLPVRREIIPSTPVWKHRLPDDLQVLPHGIIGPLRTDQGIRLFVAADSGTIYGLEIPSDLGSGEEVESVSTPGTLVPVCIDKRQNFYPWGLHGYSRSVWINPLETFVCVCRFGWHPAEPQDMQYNEIEIPVSLLAESGPEEEIVFDPVSSRIMVRVPYYNAGIIYDFST